MSILYISCYMDLGISRALECQSGNYALVFARPLEKPQIFERCQRRKDVTSLGSTVVLGCLCFSAVQAFFVSRDMDGDLCGGYKVNTIPPYNTKLCVPGPAACKLRTSSSFLLSFSHSENQDRPPDIHCRPCGRI